MGRSILITAWLLMLLCCVSRGSSQSYKIAFYNVENFYDTVPSLFYDDSRYTPHGDLRWNSSKYSSKLRNISKVIDDLGPDLIGLAEVESEMVVRDLVQNLSEDYNYIFHAGADRRGMNLALLFKGDLFVPEFTLLVRSGTARDFLHIGGSLEGVNTDLIVCHMPSRLNERRYRERAHRSLIHYADSIRSSRPLPYIVVMGDFNATPSERIIKNTLGRKDYGQAAFFSPFEPLSRKGLGTYAYNDRWQLLDNIFLSSGFVDGKLRFQHAAIFLRDYMLAPGDRRRGYPLRTFTAGRYTAGYSDHLPVYVILELKK